MKALQAVLTALLFSVSLFSTNAIQIKEDLGDESLDVGEMIINLAPGIVNDLNPPAKGAERTVTSAKVTYSENSIVYFIEGEDVFYNGRVLSTYWIRLTKKINPILANEYDIAVGFGYAAGNEGRELLSETKEFIASLLNGLYDVAEMDLAHKRVKLDRIKKSDIDPLTFDIYGVNQICDHIELNSFKMTITRHIDHRNRSLYETDLVHPYHEEHFWDRSIR